MATTITYYVHPQLNSELSLPNLLKQFSQFHCAVHHLPQPSGRLYALAGPNKTRVALGKGKFHLKTSHEGPEGEQRYGCTHPLTSALDRGGWSTPRPGRFTPWKGTRYPLYRRLGRSQSRSGQIRKTSPPPRFDPRTVQPVVYLLYRLSYPPKYM